jgi:hypothetical protein
VELTKARPGRKVWRYGGQRGYPGPAPVQLLLEPDAPLDSDHLRVAVVRISLVTLSTYSCGMELTSRLSHSAAAFRMILTPIDTLKTTLQAQGSRGTALLRQRIKTNGIGSLWWGAFATAAATFVGHYPWFATVSTGVLVCISALTQTDPISSITF